METPSDSLKMPASPEKTLTREQLKADRPTWCPGCGDFAVLAMYQKFLVDKNYPQEKIATLSGIGCSSRFPYFINTHSVHFIHGRIIAFATGLSLTRPDLFPFVIIGDGDAFSIGGNHLNHAARKNVNLNIIILNIRFTASPRSKPPRLLLWDSVRRQILGGPMSCL
jgi:2-oxoglutarate ferredoxin oxidoreductase subunit beta